MDRVKLSEETLAKTDDQLKLMSGSDLASLFCQIVKAPTAPKFADKKSAIKRIRTMAQQVIDDANKLIATADIVAAANVTDKQQSSKSPGRPKAKSKIYKFLPFDSDGDNYKRLPKQAKAIISNVTVDEDITEADLKDVVVELAETGVLQTKQDPWRIFQYYRANMINSSMLRMSNAN